MVYGKSNVPNDVEQLQEWVISISQSYAESQETIKKLTDEVRRLTTLIEKFFGKSSEKLPKEKSVVAE